VKHRDGLILKTGPKLNLKSSQISVSFLSISPSIHCILLIHLLNISLSFFKILPAFSLTQIFIFVFTIRRRKRIVEMEKYLFQLNAKHTAIANEIHSHTQYRYNHLYTYQRAFHNLDNGYT